MLQAEAIKLLKSGANVFLTGAAGSGKTYVLNEFIQYLKSERIPAGITASTGIAATHLEGITIHSWAGIGLSRTASEKEVNAILEKKRFRQRFLKTETLIIDEVSMLDADRLDLIETIMRYARGGPEPFGGMQVVLCGDFFQLPPVAAYGEIIPRPVYQSSAWKNLDLMVCYLHEQYRHGDQEYLDILNAIRDASAGGAVMERLRRCYFNALSPGPTSRYVKLYTHNVNVDSQNQRELAVLDGEGHLYVSETAGIPAMAEALKRGCLAPEKLVLKTGAAVMFVKNNFEKGYVNGTLGKVCGFNERGYPVVELFNGGEIIAEPATWSIEENGKTLAQMTQIPLRLAWAITVHKSQGMTLDAAEVDLSKCFEKGMGYVALSRVRSLKGLRVLGINDMALRINEEALLLDRELIHSSEQAAEQLRSMPEEDEDRENLKAFSVEKIRETHPSAYKKWTADEEATLRDALAGGKSMTEMAGMLGRMPGGIRSRLLKLGLIGQD